MSGELSFGSYVTTENGKKVVKELTFGSPTPEGVVLTRSMSGQLDAQKFHLASHIWPGLLRHRDDVHGCVPL